MVNKEIRTPERDCGSAKIVLENMKYKIIRLGTGYDPVIIVSPPEAGPDTPDAKYYRYASWQIGDHQPGVFNEISRNEAICYFSGQADGIGYEEPPTDIFKSIEEVSKFVEKKRREWYIKRAQKLKKMNKEI